MRDFAAAAAGAWQSSAPDDARVSLLRLLLQVCIRPISPSQCQCTTRCDEMLMTQPCCQCVMGSELDAGIDNACSRWRCGPAGHVGDGAGESQMCVLSPHSCHSASHQVEVDLLDVWAAPVGHAVHGSAAPGASLDAAAWTRHATTAWQVGRFYVDLCLCISSMYPRFRMV